MRKEILFQKQAIWFINFKEGMHISELLKLNMSATAVYNNVKLWKEFGLITLTDSKKDRRLQVIYLAEKGKELKKILNNIIKLIKDETTI